MLRLLCTCGCGLALFLACRGLLLEAYTVPTGSMEPTVAAGDRVIALKVGGIEVGDVVVFEDPEDPSRLLLKRAVAGPGQTALIRGGKVTVDGKEEATAAFASGSTRCAEGVESQEFQLGDDQWLLLGDNREGSYDGRWLGPVSEGAIVGRAVLLIPTSGETSVSLL